MSTSGLMMLTLALPRPLSDFIEAHDVARNTTANNPKDRRIASLLPQFATKTKGERIRSPFPQADDSTRLLHVFEHLFRRSRIFTVWFQLEILLKVGLGIRVLPAADVDHSQLVVSLGERSVRGDGLLQERLRISVLARVDGTRRVV